MTNKQLGDLLGVSPSMASRLRHGQRQPSLKTVLAACHSLHIPTMLAFSACLQGSEAFGDLLKETLGE